MAPFLLPFTSPVLPVRSLGSAEWRDESSSKICSREPLISRGERASKDLIGALSQRAPPTCLTGPRDTEQCRSWLKSLV